MKGLKGLFRRGKPQKSSRRLPPFMRRGGDFSAAQTDRLTSAWTGSFAAPDTALRTSLRTLRFRCRTLAVDSDYARRFFKLCRTNVVGSQGISLQVRAVERETPEGIQYDDAANHAIENAWYEWTKKKNCTVDARLSWIDLMQLAVESVAKDGEVLIRKIKGRSAGNDFGFALQVIEADHLNELHNDTLANGNEIRMGIEFNQWKRPVAYYVLNRHPGDNSFAYSSGAGAEYIRVPAEDMIHLYITERPAQSRGIPWLVSAMRRLNMLGGYEEAEVVAARGGASKMGFFKENEDGEYEGTTQDDDGSLISEFEAGIFEKLPKGIDFVPWDPQHPNGAFGTFVKSMLRGAASGMGVSYNSLANDLEGVNFSSIRQGVLEERELWKLLQTWMIEHLCDDVYEDWLLMSITMQKLHLPLAKFEKFNKPVWRPRGWSWVDPLKEVRSNREAMDAAIRSGQDVASEQGQDIEEVYAQLAREKALREKYGIVLTSDVNANAATTEAGNGGSSN